MNQQNYYWQLINNPRIWDIYSFLKNFETGDDWRVERQKDFRVGQLGVIRVGIDKRTNKIRKGKPKLQPGIYAIVVFTSLPKYSSNKNKLKYYLEGYKKERLGYRVQFKVLHNLVDNPILLSDLPKRGKAYDKLLIKGYQGPSAILKKETFDCILNLVTKERSNIKKEKTRNPKWREEELILALDLYMKNATSLPDEKGNKAIQLSNFLNELAIKEGLTLTSTYRNPNSVVMKLHNFRSFDPNYKGKALSRTSKLDKKIWNQYSNNLDELSKIANSIKKYSNEDFGDALVDDDDTTEAEEGKWLTKVHRYRERNRKIVEKKKTNELRKKGKLVCEACNFEFKKKYGERGENFIECHHIQGVSEYSGIKNTRLEDLALVCANCHRMIHKKKPWLKIEELKNIIK